MQVARTDWWYKVHGYDETLADGLGSMDSDLWFRARSAGMKILRMPFANATAALHQWHPPSHMKGALYDAMTRTGTPLVRNTEDWGTLRS